MARMIKCSYCDKVIGIGGYMMTTDDDIKCWTCMKKSFREWLKDESIKEILNANTTPDNK